MLQQGGKGLTNRGVCGKIVSFLLVTIILPIIIFQFRIYIGAGSIPDKGTSPIKAIILYLPIHIWREGINQSN